MRRFSEIMYVKTLSSGIHQVYIYSWPLNNTGLNSAGRYFSIDPHSSNLSCSSITSLVGYPRRQTVVIPGFSTVRERGTANPLPTPACCSRVNYSPSLFFTKENCRGELISFLHCFFVPLLQLLLSLQPPCLASDKGNVKNGFLTEVPLQRMQRIKDETPPNAMLSVKRKTLS